MLTKQNVAIKSQCVPFGSEDAIVDTTLCTAATSITTVDNGFGLGTSATTIAAGTVTASGAGSTSANRINNRTALAK